MKAEAASRSLDKKAPLGVKPWKLFVTSTASSWIEVHWKTGSIEQAVQRIKKVLRSCMAISFSINAEEAVYFKDVWTSMCVYVCLCVCVCVGMLACDLLHVFLS